MKKTSKKRQGEILEKSAVLFHQRGYAATSIRDIAHEMNMKSASLYNHIDSKQEILQLILVPLAEKYTRGMKKIAASSDTSVRKLEQIIVEHIRITIEHTDDVSLIPNEWIHLEEKQRNKFLKLRSFYEKEFKRIFRKAIKDGYLRNVDVDIASFSILSTLRRLYSWYSKNQKVKAGVLEKELTMNLIGGLKV